ncbi:MAG TPA: Asp-tRNA(Asn)/Glu-tRNA(Gln) amidotransferase subunit GatB [bacterium]|nr:Asp-tRNA(Asn)/Glu-tRNA(Gln) amidotransferase subunit GatB [bacterium]
MTSRASPPRAGLARETVIGLEVHVQLSTTTKMFCGSAVAFGAPPNTLTCPVCLGLPGSLPVLNRRAVELGLRTALVLGCRIHPESQFHRKNYYYPDLPKNFQISQYQYAGHPPLATEGALTIESGGPLRRIGIRRVHLEEDTGKLVHADGRSLVDYNRSGVPLMEVVTEPDLRSPEEARLFLARLRAVLQYAGVSSGRLEEGTFRCDANLSLRAPGGPPGIRTEIKNMNSLRSVERALRFEEARQRETLDRGESVVQETRHWDEQREITFPSREKEEAQDYRYFPEPDLVPLRIDGAWIERIRADLPELPEARRRRYMEVYGLPEHDARLVTATRPMAEFFEETVRLCARPKIVSNWLTGDVAAYLNAAGVDIDEVPIRPAHLAELLTLLDTGTLSGRSAKDVLEEMLRTGRPAGEIVAERGLVQISDEGHLRRLVDDVIAEQPGPVRDVRAGKERAMAFLVGQVMKKTQGRANPEMVNRILRERLGAG